MLSRTPPNKSARRLHRTLGVIALALLIPGNGGCTYFDSGSDLAAGLEKATETPDAPDDVLPPQKLRWDGGGIIIGETDTLAYTTETLLTTVAEMSGKKRFASVENLIENYPDIALQALQEAEPNRSNQQALQMIANVLDTVWCDSGLLTRYVSDLTSLPKRSSGKLDVRTRFWRYLKNHQPDQALKLRITKTLKRDHGTMMRADFHRLESIAAMMMGKHDESIASLETAISLVRTPCPSMAAKLELLLGEFYRHASRWDEWKSTWEKAVVTNSRLIDQRRTLDPGFWDRAAFLRPAGMDWPPEAINNLKSFLRNQDALDTENSLALESDESIIWFAIAYRHLERAEGQNAILAFKKSEAGETRQHAISTLQFYQARALVASGQPGAASAILFRLVSDNPGTTLADRSKAILSTMKMQNGSVAQGLNLIQSAIGSVERWPKKEQLKAQADFALALLVLGRESEGMRRLDLAEDGFKKAGDQQQVRQCIWNRAKYYEKTEQDKLFETASTRLMDMEQILH